MEHVKGRNEKGKEKLWLPPSSFHEPEEEELCLSVCLSVCMYVRERSERKRRRRGHFVSTNKGRSSPPKGEGIEKKRRNTHTSSPA